MEAFYVIGSVLAVWALIVSFLGITRKGFPASVVAERTVGAISALLVIAAIGAAIVGSASESEEEHEDEAALVLPR